MLQLISFFSDIGGVLGLWFGIAIMTVLEFIEITTDVIVMTLRKLAKRVRRRE